MLIIDLIQPTHILDKVGNWFFSFCELMNIVLGSILSPQQKPSLFHRKTAKNPTSLTFYIDIIFGAFKIHSKQYIFLCDHFFLHMVLVYVKAYVIKIMDKYDHNIFVER